MLDTPSNFPDLDLDELERAAADQVTTGAAAQKRVDPVSGNVVLFAPTRSGRPNQFQTVAAPVSDDHGNGCPFCAGAEDKTPSSVWAGRVSDAALRGEMEFDIETGELANAMLDWQVRVVPNKFPAVSHSPELTHSDQAIQTRGLFQSNLAYGGHEVIIESDRHVVRSTDAELAEVTLTNHAYRGRIKHWSEREEVEYISVFKNFGGKAGASLVHAHSQLIATDFVPPAVANQVKRMVRYRAQTGCCMHCNIIRSELKSSQRVVTRTNRLLAYCPFASRAPMMVRIMPTSHENRFEDTCDETLEELARLIVRFNSWLQLLHPESSHNVLLHTQPTHSVADPGVFHWSVEILPRLTSLAGFEFSSECMINPVLPETAAEMYRACLLAESPSNVVPPIN